MWSVDLSGEPNVGNNECFLLVRPLDNFESPDQFNWQWIKSGSNWGAFGKHLWSSSRAHDGGFHIKVQCK